MEKTFSLTKSALLLTLLITSGFIVIPTPWAVPFTLQTMVLMLTGLMLPIGRATKLVLVFLAAGAMGFPFFAGGAGGLAYIAGPTGGFLLGFLAVRLTVNLVCKSKPEEASKLRISGACAAGLVPVYLTGILWLVLAHKQTLMAAFTVAVIPFIPAALIKVFLATTLYLRIRKPKKQQ